MSARSMRRWLAAALCLVAAGAVAAGERRHTVRSGESASSIAKRHYGDYQLATLLLLYNGKTSSVIRPGEKLRVPYSEVHRVRSGDTWSALAQRYLGQARAYRAIAGLNGLPPERPLQVGQKLVMPVVLEHRLQRGETLAALAERFYGDPGLGSLLGEFNRIDDPRRLSVGQPIGIPLVSLTLKGAGAPTLAAARAPEARPAAARSSRRSTPRPKTSGRAAARKPTPAPDEPPYRADLVAARRAFDEGEYHRARTLLESLGRRVGSRAAREDRVEVWRLLSFVYVAFDQPERACEAQRTWRSLDRGGELDPDLVSPKIRQALSRCG